MEMQGRDRATQTGNWPWTREDKLDWPETRLESTEDRQKTDRGQAEGQA